MADAQKNSGLSLFQSFIFFVAYNVGCLSGRMQIAVYRAKCALHSRYRYQPLPPGEQFRYLELQPGTGYDPLVCNLITTPLREAQFEAISYVWGSPERTHDIWCNGRPLKITSSLFIVLCRLRHRHSPRRLWADGACINQDDMKEKGHQVGFMGKIYQAAQRVLLCAGFWCGEDGEHLSTLLRDVRSSIDVELQKVDPSTFGTFPWLKSDDPKLTDPRWAAMSRLLQETWFDRGWVLREAALAQSGLLIWGQSQYDWDDLMMVLTWVSSGASTIAGRHIVDMAYYMPHLQVYRDRHTASLRAFFTEDQSRPRPLLEYLCFTLGFSDPHDRIYAFLDLATESLDGLVLEPNYELSVEEVFHDFAEKYTQATGDTRLLEFAIHLPQCPESSLPSWVPSWDLIVLGDKPSREVGGHVLCPQQRSFHRPEVVDRATLKVHGVVFDSVRFLSEVFYNEATTPKDVLRLANHVRDNAGPSPYPASMHEQAIFSTLTRNGYIGAWDAWHEAESLYIQSLHEHKDSPSSFEWDSSDPQAPKLTFVHVSLRRSMHATRFMLTERGYMGSAPANAQEGDLCSIVFSCHSPSLLRPAATKSKYVLLGPAYVLGSHFTEYRHSDDYRTREEGSEEVCTSIPHTQPLGYFNAFGREGKEEWTEWAEEQDIYLV